MSFSKKNHQKIAFTLVELLATISIIAIILTIAIASFSNTREDSRNNQRVSDIKQIQLALEKYYSDNGSYPNELNFGESLATGSKTYMSTLPTNPTPRDDGDCSDNEYQYSYNPEINSYMLGFCISRNSSDVESGTNYALPIGISSATSSFALWNGCTNYWKMDDNTTNSTINNSTGYKNGILGLTDGNTFTPKNTNDASITGKINTGLTFYESEIYTARKGIILDTDSDFSFGNGNNDVPLSISFWIYLNSMGTTYNDFHWNFLINKRRLTQVGSEYYLWLYEASTDVYRIMWYMLDPNSIDNGRIYGYTTINQNDFINTWNHVVVTYDGSSSYNGFNIYINGESQNTIRSGGGTYVATDNRSDCLFTINGFNNSDIYQDGRGLNFGIDGVMDEVGIWKGRELTATDVEILYNQGTGRTYNE
ncbi:MAG: prepilin-type N-terminal cleavage/methylation domain-containing protein [Patescibacteria group bacterium]|nr:prepilin-type N-terminal cleavage/methylation domain-containing protein [Patescibacteria group bacterium]